jgi:hypothetical protein
MDVTDDAGEDDHPELPPQSDVWLAEQQVVAAAATLRELDATAENPAAQRAALVAYRTAWLRFMVSLCNLPLADRPAAVERVMEALREVDEVAYVRFASVYRNFREAKDFEAFLDKLGAEGEAAVPPVPDAAR